MALRKLNRELVVIGLAIGGGLGVLGALGLTAPQEATAWEYRVEKVHPRSSADQVEAALNGLAAEGWRLHCVDPNGGRADVRNPEVQASRYVYKRPKQPAAE